MMGLFTRLDRAQREEAINMQSTEAHMKEKQRREKIEIIFSHRVKGESYFHGSSYKWKNKELALRSTVHSYTIPSLIL